jgi:hypothetical protein
VQLLSRLFRHPFRYYAISAAAGIVAALLSLLRTGFDLRIYYADAFTLAGLLLILIGLLLLTTHYGVFDIFGYSFSTFRERRYKTLYDYSQAHDAKRKRSGWRFMTPITVGAVFLIIGLLIWPR